MPNINAFRPVVQEEIFKGFYYINLYKTMSPCDPRESPCPKDVPCQIFIHSGQWFIRIGFLNVFAV